jgi:aspartyl-tRNA(Asn)/glutamyl-tRNA(Gln) amidotransferase subunit C
MINKKQIEHLALLARIELSSEEKDSFTKQVEKILEFVSSLQQVNTRAIEPDFYFSDKQELRTDEIIISSQADNVRQAMPEKSNGQLKTPKIFS